MKITKPTANQVFTITATPEWPSIDFETDATGTHVWNWEIKWLSFSKKGTETTTSNTWNASKAIANLGGVLKVTVAANKLNATVTIKITGTNPSDTQIKTYLSSKPNSSGFDKILEHESKFKHFNASNEPVKSFDNGYGMCQLTTPPPTYEQAWNWKLNIDGGLNLFDQKRTAAKNYLSQSSRSYTDDELKYESVCRWNGGSYHVWDSANKKWVRDPNILCDQLTGNIGWDMTDEQNKGKSESVLHERDKASYSKPPQAGAHWKYSGVCYADRILNN